MAVVITMPKFGLTMKEGTVSNWSVHQGRWVDSGETLFEVETDKITNEIEAPQSGILRHIFIKDGETADVGTPVAIIAEENEDISNFLQTDSFSDDQEVDAVNSPPLQPEEAAKSEFIKATPLAKKLAREQRIPLDTIAPSGPNQVIVARDIRDESTNRASKPAISPLAKKYAEEHRVDWENVNLKNRIMLPDIIEEQLKNQNTYEVKKEQQDLPPRTVPMSGIRKVIAERMTSSWSTIPHVTLQKELDVSSLKKALSTLSIDGDTKLTYTHFLIAIVAAALKKHPALNAWCDNNELTYHDNVHIGVAVSLEEGLVVPVIRDANKLDLLQIAKRLKDVSARAKENRLTVDEMRGGTFTISNLGMMGIDGFTPIINPPETGILGVGRIIDKPVYVGETIVKCPMLTLSLSFDHCALDGAEAASFLQTIQYYIQEPLRLLAKG
ncbi:dihydrolipoamide acetyltransferase family protein [Sutcliffiella rhizosphaerae]|uniref:Dihydrolipoamide acetyltransferase component of pyruvate dehydrogenase complex n=1 Tax=Sutcliffiella rhizosphaerae TaxID=2880967 RepID=A0ABN8ABZ8_9BACI|nr:dihydrolipoamide acetyltransferase family protein [Sutcliffiella rhizosphaerae]CAG9622738.1 Dihydrolipoyllysine-residue acetyltransferase component of pyruvate dehydrogenase complex [Sutcliffiella rhizosphaerae]